MDILKVAITGSAGSGKSLVCKRFGEKGFHTLDCDVIARQVVQPGHNGFESVVQLFGRQVVATDGGLDRSRLRSIIVRDDQMRKKLEAILHPKILEEMIFQMENADYAGKLKAVAVEVPLLFETGMEKYFDISVAVISEMSTLIDRVSRRDGVHLKEAEKMLDLQMPQDEKISRADHVVKNGGTLSELFDSVDDLLVEIQKEFLTS